MCFTWLTCWNDSEEYVHTAIPVLCWNAISSFPTKQSSLSTKLVTNATSDYTEILGSHSAVTQLKLRLPEVDRPIFRSDLLLRVTHNELAQSKKKKTALPHQNTPVCLCQVQVSCHTEWTFTWRRGCHSCFRSRFFFVFVFFFNWSTACGRVLILIVWNLISNSRGYRGQTHGIHKGHLPVLLQWWISSSKQKWNI